MKVKTSTKKFRELEEALIPFREFWEEWIHSPACYLSKEEIDIILLSQHYQDFEIVASKIGRTKQGAYMFLQNAIRKLRYESCKIRYRHWIAERMLEDAGVYEDFTPLEKFLITPTYYFPLSSRLSSGLSSCGETFGEILKDHGEFELLRIRNFGKKSLTELKSFLKKHNAHRLLKKRVHEDEYWYLK